MTQLQEHDAMRCRACGNEEPASEGYPCQACDTFVCQICDNRGITLCRACREKQGLPEPSNLPVKRVIGA